MGTFILGTFSTKSREWYLPFSLIYIHSATVTAALATVHIILGAGNTEMNHGKEDRATEMKTG
jgi:hypothetical protein